MPLACSKNIFSLFSAPPPHEGDEHSAWFCSHPLVSNTGFSGTSGIAQVHSRKRVTGDWCEVVDTRNKLAQRFRKSGSCSRSMLVVCCGGTTRHSPCRTAGSILPKWPIPWMAIVVIGVRWTSSSLFCRSGQTQAKAESLVRASHLFGPTSSRVVHSDAPATPA